MSDNALRRLALSWVRENCPIVQANFSERLDDLDRRRANGTFLIASELTRSGRPYLLSCHAGELFVFALRRGQAKRLGAVARRMLCTEGGPRLEIPPSRFVPVEIADLQFDGDARVHPNEEIRGACGYCMHPDFQPQGQLCLMLGYELSGRRRVRSWYYPPMGLLPEGNLDFKFPPIAGSGHDCVRWTGTTVAHVRFFTVGAPQIVDDRHPLSNTCAALLDVR